MSHYSDIERMFICTNEHMYIYTYVYLFICVNDHLSKMVQIPLYHRLGFLSSTFYGYFAQSFTSNFSVLHKEDHFIALKRESKIRLKNAQNPGDPALYFCEYCTREKACLCKSDKKIFYLCAKCELYSPVRVL